MEWEVVEDGYNKRLRLVERPSGRIIGHVSGCRYDSSEPWYAFTEGPEGSHRLGEFVSEGFAKRAVEAALTPAPPKEDHHGDSQQL